MKVGMIGLGKVAERMIMRSRGNPDVIFTHMCDVSEERVQQFARQEHAKGHVDYKALLNQEDVDLVYVSVPPALHYQVVIEALEHGKHVLCEKPLANSLEEARLMVEHARKSGFVNAMQFTLQYGPAIPRIRELQREHYLGKLRRIEMVLRFPDWPRPTQNVGWVGSREQGGMALEVCTHLIHAIQTQFGRIVHVETELEYQDDPQLCEQGILARMALEDGTPITLNALANIAGKEEVIALSFYGTDGTLSMSNWNELVGGRRGEAIQEIVGAQPLSIMSELHKAISGQEARIFDFESGYQAQLVMEALRGRTELVRVDGRG